MFGYSVFGLDGFAHLLTSKTPACKKLYKKVKGSYIIRDEAHLAHIQQEIHALLSTATSPKDRETLSFALGYVDGMQKALNLEFAGIPGITS